MRPRGGRGGGEGEQEVGDSEDGVVALHNLDVGNAEVGGDGGGRSGAADVDGGPDGRVLDLIVGEAGDPSAGREPDALARAGEVRAWNWRKTGRGSASRCSASASAEIQLAGFAALTSGSSSRSSCGGEARVGAGPALARRCRPRAW